MTLRNYFLLSAGIFILAVAALRYLPIPILPFVLILLVGETLLGFQVENHKVGRLLSAFFTGPKHGAPASNARHDLKA
jgi:D-alanyl-lipoteichoic acid acyltransferase DltB (MBOAT superfamily)